MRATIAIANHKGGVGKTITAVNLAGRLAGSGRRTLLVDVDPQAHATFWFADALDVHHDLEDVVVRQVPTAKAVLPTRIQGLDLLPATPSLARLEPQLVVLASREECIRQALETVKDDYVYTVLDLAPNLGLGQLAALAAATDIIAPVSATKLGMAAFGSFLAWLEERRQDEVLTARLLGALVTMAEPRTRTTREVVEALRASGLPMFRTVIPRRIAVEDQVSERRIAGESGKGGPVGEAYDELASEVIVAIEHSKEVESRG